MDQTEIQGGESAVSDLGGQPSPPEVELVGGPDLVNDPLVATVTETEGGPIKLTETERKAAIELVDNLIASASKEAAQVDPSPFQPDLGI